MRFSEPASRKMPSTSVATACVSGFLCLTIERHTFFLEENATFGHNNGYVTVDVALSRLVEKRYCYICIGDAGDERYAENAGHFGVCCRRDVLAHICDKPETVGDSQATTKLTLGTVPPSPGWLLRATEGQRSGLGQAKATVPFSSSFLGALRLLNCFHQEVRSRFAEAGSTAVGGGAG